VRRLSPFLISIIVLASLLAHHVHAPVATAGVPAEQAAVEHVHHGAKQLQIVDHGMLDDIVPELCVVGEQAPPPISGGHGQVALITPQAHGEALLSELLVVPTWETPAIAPDVLRALLQVFLN
jgi:hypothetical protein